MNGRLDGWLVSWYRVVIVRACGCCDSREVYLMDGVGVG